MNVARSQIGTVGSLGRWGGDEFVAVLFETGHDAAATIAERVQHAFEKAAAEIDGRPTHVTVSTGMVYSPSGPFELEALMVRADRALYRAKTEGRNRLSIAPPELPATTPAVEEPVGSPNNVVPLSRRSTA